MPSSVLSRRTGHWRVSLEELLPWGQQHAQPPASATLPKAAGGAGAGAGLTLALHIWVTPEELLALPAGPASEAWHALALSRELPKEPQQEM